MGTIIGILKAKGRDLLKRWYKSRLARPLFVPVRSARLQALFHFADIRVLDIGARGGPLGSFSLLAPYTHLFICEPDVREIQNLEKRLVSEGMWKRVTAIPAALGSKPGTAVLHLAEKPGLSSLLEINIPEIKKYYSISGWGHVEKDVSVPVMTLDEAFSTHVIRNLSFLKLDTQGMELDILRSGEKKVLPQVLGVMIEMEYVPLYKEQPLFTDVHVFLEQRGFRLIDLKRTNLRRKTAAKPAYSKRELLWAHGLYVREKNSDGTLLTPEQSVRLACCMAACEYFDYAVWLLERPEVEAYLREHGFEGAAREVAAYADSFWNVLQRQLTWLEKREAVGSVRTDRKYER